MARIVVYAALLGVASLARAECPPAHPPPICLLVTLREPTTANAALLRERLREDGLDLQGPRGDLVITASPQRLRALGVRVRYTMTGASSSDRMICLPVVRVRLPARYSALIRTLRHDPQLC